MGGLLNRRGGGGLNVTVDATPSVDVHRPRSLRESRRASPYGRSPYEAPRHKQLPPLQLAPTLPTPGTQLSNGIGGLALAPISARTRRATKAWARPPAARQHAASHARSPVPEKAEGVEFEAYLKLHGFTTERTPEEKKKKEKGTKGKKRASPRETLAAGPSFVPPLVFVPPPNLVPQPPPPEEAGRVPAKLAAVRAARGKRRHLHPCTHAHMHMHACTHARMHPSTHPTTHPSTHTSSYSYTLLARLRAETVTLDEELHHSAEQALMANLTLTLP